MEFEYDLLYAGKDYVVHPMAQDCRSSTIICKNQWRETVVVQTWHSGTHAVHAPAHVLIGILMNYVYVAL